MDYDNVIEIRDLTKIYTVGEIEVRALRGVNMDVRKGELMTIMEPLMATAERVAL